MHVRRLLAIKSRLAVSVCAHVKRLNKVTEYETVVILKWVLYKLRRPIEGHCRHGRTQHGRNARNNCGYNHRGFSFSDATTTCNHCINNIIRVECSSYSNSIAML